MEEVNYAENYTSWFGSNNDGVLTGNWAGLDDPFFLFVLGVIQGPDGTTVVDEAAFPSIDYASAGFTYITATEINDKGEAVGETYDTSIAAFRVWFRAEDGRYELLPIAGNWQFLTASGINNRGTIVGTVNRVVAPGEPFDFQPYGYTWRRGELTRIEVPGAEGTTVEGVDDRGRLVGQYLDPASGAWLPYLWDRGRVEVLSPPGVDNRRLVPHDINNRGQITGTYLNLTDPASPRVRGFVLDGDHITLIDFEGSEFGNVELFGISDDGAVAGTYDFLSWGLVGTPECR